MSQLGVRLHQLACFKWASALQWRHNEHDGVSNHQPHDCLLNRADQRKHQSSASTAFVSGIHRGPVNSPHKWPVTREVFPFDDIIRITKSIRYVMRTLMLNAMILLHFVMRTCLMYHNYMLQLTAHTIVWWPNPKQWIIVHTSDLMVLIRQSAYSISYSMSVWSLL